MKGEDQVEYLTAEYRTRLRNLLPDNDMRSLVMDYLDHVLAMAMESYRTGERESL